MYSKKLTNFGVGLYMKINQTTLIFQLVHQILQLYISSCILFQNMCLNYVHMYLQLYDINTGGSVAA